LIDAAGQAIDLTGWSVAGQIRRRHTGELLYEWGAEHDNVGHPDYPLEDGWVAIGVPWTDSVTWGWVDTAHDYEVRAITPAGDPCYVDGGLFYPQSTLWRMAA
jgi:hypothetical protein